ncbi:hypothetical protein Y032_0030g2198 [Ancylostoma ceylanicum]|uniref:F-box domain-containing protein n=1 Tax=Ancylostoma ceylanicum TaxID=53326 RepID=A0A016UR50_9BILA|nr:hypothetical protein Y032_0030g2198 [Ancylostoma ceylanicum]
MEEVEMEEVPGMLIDFHITSDEHEFHRWSELPLDIKTMILEYIPFPTLRNFMFLSKECFSLVTRMNTLIFYVHLSNVGPEHRIENFVQLSLSWPLPGRKEQEQFPIMYTLHFVEDGKGGCSVRRVTDDEEWKFISAGLHYDRSARFMALATLFHLTTYLNIRSVFAELDALDPRDEEVFSMQPEGRIIARDEFFITAGSNALIPRFLPFVEPGCPLVILPLYGQEDIFLRTPFFDSALVQSSRKLQIEVNNEVTDDQIVLFRAYDISMPAPKVTAKAINRMISEWLERKRNINFIQFKEVYNVTIEDVLQGSKIKNVGVEWKTALDFITAQIS